MQIFPNKQFRKLRYSKRGITAQKSAWISLYPKNAKLIVRTLSSSEHALSSHAKCKIECLFKIGFISQFDALGIWCFFSLNRIKKSKNLPYCDNKKVFIEDIFIFKTLKGLFRIWMDIKGD